MQGYLYWEMSYNYRAQWPMVACLMKKITISYTTKIITQSIIEHKIVKNYKK